MGLGLDVSAVPFDMEFMLDQMLTDTADNVIKRVRLNLECQC